MDFAVPSAVPLVRIKLDSTNKILSYVYICLLPSEVSLQLKILPKNIYKNKCREDEIDTIFNSPCLITKNISMRACLFTFHHITIFTFATMWCFTRFGAICSEKYPWRSVAFHKVIGWNFTKSNTPPWVFFTFLKLYKGSKSCNASQMLLFLCYISSLQRILDSYKPRLSV